MKHTSRIVVALLGLLALFAAGCGSDESTTTTASGDAVESASTSAAQSTESAERPTIAVTTNILGDVVTQMVGDHADVITIMPVGADPHDFQASAQQVAAIGNAAVLIVNGGDFEEGLLDVIESAEGDGVLVYEAIDGVETIEYGAGGHSDHDDHGDEHGDDDHDDHDDEHGDKDHDDHGDEHGDDDHDDEHGEHGDEDHDDHDDEHGDEDHDDEHGDEDKDHDDKDHDDEDHDDHDDHDDHGDEHAGHDHDGADPHFFTDPARMAIAADGIADFLVANLDGVDTEAMQADAASYIDELEALDAEVATALAGLDDSQRVLITNHEVFGYFADRYDFEVVGTVIPSGSTTDGASAQRLAELVDVISDEGVPAIFADTSSSNELAETLASEVGDIAVIELFTESLGDDGSGGATYLEMVRTNAELIVDALG